MTEPASATFSVAESHDQEPHQYSVLEPSDPNWLATLSDLYRALRTDTAFPLTDLDLNGVTVIDATALAQRLAATQLPERSTSAKTKQLAVERSDFGEVALALAGEELRGYAYGYRSTRDRELVTLPGRGIDQIGVRSTELDGGEGIVVSFGEAKVSADPAAPPSVVDSAKDSLRAQHLAHVGEAEVTTAKLHAAAKRCTDPNTQRLLLLAATLWQRQQFDYLVIKSTSFLVRPKHGAAADFGKFATQPADFVPGHIDFMILRLQVDDIEAVVDEFLAKARVGLEDDAE